MTRRDRRVLSLAGAVVLALGAVAAKPRPAAKTKGVTLAVVIAVDGISWERLALYRPWYTAGLKRLLDEGQVETACRYRHINTETGPGHASIGTGEPPRLHGIVGNAWYEAGADGKPRNVYCTDQRLGEADVAGPGNLLRPTLADLLVQKHGGSRVVSLSGKDRSAIFLAGRDRRHGAYWFDTTRGEFKTSPAYDPPPAVQALVAAFNAASAGEKLPSRFGQIWKPLAPPADGVARPTAIPASVFKDYQIPSLGLGWDHPLDWNGRRYPSALFGTPFMDTLLTDFALAFLGDENIRLGRGASPDLLALSFSAHDVVAHSYGAESEEALDVVRRLDLELGRLLDGLDRHVGRSKVVLGLSADHGFVLIPEAARARDGSYRGGRLPDGRRTMVDFVQRLDRHVGEELCLAPGTRTLLGNHGWTMTYDRAAFPLRTVAGPCGEAGREVQASDVDRVLPGAVRRLYAEEIDGVWLVSERERWPESHPATEYVRNAFYGHRSGDAILLPRPGVMVHWDPGRGSTHGTHHDYDTQVPLVFWGAGFSARESGEASTPYDLAPTLAGPLGIDMKTEVGRARR